MSTEIPGAGHPPAPGRGLARHAARLYHEALTRHCSVNGYTVTHSWEQLPLGDQVLLIAAMAETLAGLGVEAALAMAIRQTARADQLAAQVVDITDTCMALTFDLAAAEEALACSAYPAADQPAAHELTPAAEAVLNRHDP